MSVLKEPDLISQQTVGQSNGDTVDKLTFRVESGSRVLARNRIRAHVRREFPLVKNVLSPNVEDAQETKQSGIREFAPDTFHTEIYEIEVLVVR